MLQFTHADFLNNDEGLNMLLRDTVFKQKLNWLNTHRSKIQSIISHYGFKDLPEFALTEQFLSHLQQVPLELTQLEALGYSNQQLLEQDLNSIIATFDAKQITKRNKWAAVICIVALVALAVEIICTYIPFLNFLKFLGPLTASVDTWVAVDAISTIGGTVSIAVLASAFSGNVFYQIPGIGRLLKIIDQHFIEAPFSSWIMATAILAILAAASLVVFPPAIPLIASVWLNYIAKAVQAHIKGGPVTPTPITEETSPENILHSISKLLKEAIAEQRYSPRYLEIIKDLNLLLQNQEPPFHCYFTEAVADQNLYIQNTYILQDICTRSDATQTLKIFKKLTANEQYSPKEPSNNNYYHPIKAYVSMFKEFMNKAIIVPSQQQDNTDKPQQNSQSSNWRSPTSATTNRDIGRYPFMLLSSDTDTETETKAFTPIQRRLEP